MTYPSTDILLSMTTTYGPFALGMVLFLSSLGFPFPSAILILATGALAQHGIVDWRAVLLVGLTGTVLGDSASYALGRSFGGWISRRSRRWIEAWSQAEAFLRRHGGSAVYATRFLLPALDVPTNLLAGSGGFPLRRFLFWSIAGRITWIVLYGILGYAAGSHSDAVAEILSRYSVWLSGLVVLGLGLYAWLRGVLPVHATSSFMQCVPVPASDSSTRTFTRSDSATEI